jgi:hypothetical protein
MGGPIFNVSVEATDNGAGYGVKGSSTRQRAIGVYGMSGGYAGVVGESSVGNGVIGSAGTPELPSAGIGVGGRVKYAEFDPNYNNVAVYGRATDGVGVLGHSDTHDGVQAFTRGAGRSGLYARNTGSGFGVYAESQDGVGVLGQSVTHDGVQAFSTGAGRSGLYARNTSAGGYAAYLQGNVRITGTLQKGGGSFKIDHPLDPANKYLSHSFVESPDMKNVYDGVVTLDDKGEAEIELPDWFGALNKDFRYQLTAIGAPGPNLYIAEEISDDAATTSNYNNNKSRFKVAGGTSGMKVSWQVTGIRKDPWANAHRIPVEEDKPAKERGYYTYPELYGQPEEKGISHLLVPEIRERAAAHK